MIICGASPANHLSTCSTWGQSHRFKRTAHCLELHSYSSDLLPLDLSKILMNFWTIKILFPGKKHLLQFSGTTSSLVSISSLICDVPLVLVIQENASHFWPRSPAMIHQEKQRTLGTEDSDMQFWLIPPSSRTEVERHEQSWARIPKSTHTCFRVKFYTSNLKLRTSRERQLFAS